MRRTLALFAGLVFAFAGCGPRDAPDEADRAGALPPAVTETADSSAGTVGATWEPQDPYWESYRAILVQADCDSSGRVKRAEILSTYASRAETDSILELSRGVTLDPKSFEGKMDWWQKENPDDADLRFILPFVTRGPGTEPEPTLVSRRDLDTAGLGPWLAIWDETLPEWPVETWRVRWPNRLYEYPPEVVFDDAELVARNMVSFSPDRAWRLHRFLGTEFTPEGKMAFDVDSGYLVYRSRPPRQARGHVTGTSTSYASAEWIDSTRFVIAAMGEADLTMAGRVVMYRVPMVTLGHVDSLTVTTLVGPPVPLRDSPVVWKRLDAYVRGRYPEYWQESR